MLLVAVKQKQLAHNPMPSCLLHTAPVLGGLPGAGKSSQWRAMAQHGSTSSTVGRTHSSREILLSSWPSTPKQDNRSGPQPPQQACLPEPSSSSSAVGRASATAGYLVIEGALGMVFVQWCLCLHSYHLHDCWPDGLSWLDAGSSSFHKAMVEVGKVSRCSRCPCVLILSK